MPFQGMSRDEFYQTVVLQGLRPKLDKSWPVKFSELLTACWAEDPFIRPGFDEVVNVLDELLRELHSGILGSVAAGISRSSSGRVLGGSQSIAQTNNATSTGSTTTMAGKNSSVIADPNKYSGGVLGLPPTDLKKKTKT